MWEPHSPRINRARRRGFMVAMFRPANRARLRVVVLAAAALVAVATLRWAGPGEVRAVRVTLAGIRRVMFKAIEGRPLHSQSDGIVPPSWLTTF
jgi:hypothetical protein